MAREHSTHEFWAQYLRDQGFREHIGQSTEWVFITPIPQNSMWTWYTKDNILIGIDADNKHSPHIYFVIDPKSEDFIAVAKIFDYTDNFFTVIEALSNPKLMPLCINIPWAENIVEYYLKLQ